MFAIRSRRKVSTKEALVSLFSKTTLRKSIYVLLIFISTAHWLLFELNSLGFSFFSRKKIEDQKTQSSFWKKNETYSGFENLFWFLLWQVATEKDFLEAVNKVIKAYAKFSATPRYMTYNWEQNSFSSSVYSFIVRFLAKNLLLSGKPIKGKTRDLVRSISVLFAAQALTGSLYNLPVFWLSRGFFASRRSTALKYQALPCWRWFFAGSINQIGVLIEKLRKKKFVDNCVYALRESIKSLQISALSVCAMFDAIDDCCSGK